MAKSKEKKQIQEQPKEICFVIMPFGGWFDEYYNRVFCPAISEADLEPHRADDLYAPSNVVKDIWQYTLSSKIIVAVLTEKNPNVFYELGLAHAITKPAILVAESEDDIPFDLRHIRHLKYDKNDPEWGEKLRTDLQKAIKEILKSPDRAIPSTFLREKTSTPEPVSKQDKNIIAIREDLDLLRRQIASVSRPIHAGGTTGSHVRRSSPEDALVLIKTLLQQGAPRGYIRERLANFGAPPEWTDRKIIEIQAELESPKD